MDIDDNDVNEDGSIASIMNPETGETVDDLRIPTNDPEYTPMVEALKADTKDVLVTVLEAMGIRKIQAQFIQKVGPVACARLSNAAHSACAQRPPHTTRPPCRALSSQDRT